MTKKHATIVETFITRFSKESMISSQDIFAANKLGLNFSSVKCWLASLALPTS